MPGNLAYAQFAPFFSPQYFENLFDSTLVGGITPLEGLFGITGYSDQNENLSSSSTVSDSYGSEASSPSFDYSNETADIYQSVKDATDLQNQASQSSADRAMEFSEEQARLAREFNAAQAQKAMDYQTEMFGKRYQMTMEDLRKAGLNPKLVGSLGSPSAPSGVAASASAPEGINANMSMQNISAVAGVLETYMTNVNALDRNENDFVKDVLTTLLGSLIPGVNFLSKF